MYDKNVIDCGVSVIAHFRCEQCWESHSISFSNPIFTDCQPDPLELRYFNGPSGYRYTYWKCHREGSDSYTLIANVGRYATREIIEALGLIIVAEPDEMNELPDHRLYEIK
jgi:hypothetical protein